MKGQESDIVCLQELGTETDWSHFDAESFVSALGNGYEYHQAGTTAVLWNPSLYTALETGNVDCTISAENGGDGYSRICAWVKLKRIEDNAVFYIVSAHLDLNKPNDSARVLVNYFNGFDRVIVAGDFNADETRKSVQNLFADAAYTNTNVDFTKVLAENANLQDDWNHDADGYPSNFGLTPTFPTHNTIIDWCYVKGGFTVSEFEVVSSAGDTASDHYPIYVELKVR